VAAAILQNQKVGVSQQQLCDRSLQNLALHFAYWSFPPYRPLKFPHFKKPRWRTATIFKIEKSPYLSNSLKFGWTTYRYFEPIDPSNP